MHIDSPLLVSQIRNLLETNFPTIDLCRCELELVHESLTLHLISHNTNNYTFEFTFNTDNDTASYRHCLEWKIWKNEKWEYDGYQNDSWSLNMTNEEVVKCLKQRINKFIKLYEMA